jgi:hypothetical protein
MEAIQLADGGILLYDDAFLTSDLADRYFNELRDMSAWEQMPGVFGHMQPRLTASYGDEGVTYRYSGTVNVALPWTPTLLEIKQKIEAVQGQFNYCLLNRYRTGQDSMGMHADDEPEMGNVIGSLFLGCDEDISDQAQQEEGGEELSRRQRHAHHHGRDDAAVLEARDSEDHGKRRRTDQSDVQTDREGVTMSKSHGLRTSQFRRRHYAHRWRRHSAVQHHDQAGQRPGGSQVREGQGDLYGPQPLWDQSCRYRAGGRDMARRRDAATTREGHDPAAVFIAGVSPRLPMDERTGALPTSLPPA